MMMARLIVRLHRALCSLSLDGDYVSWRTVQLSECEKRIVLKQSIEVLGLDGNWILGLRKYGMIRSGACHPPKPSLGARLSHWR